MNRLFRLIVGCAALFAACGFSHAAQDGKPGAEKRHRIMMILFRGMTDAERGFMNYFAERKIPVEFIVRDAEGDGARVAGFMEEIRNTRPDLIYTFGTTVTASVVGKVGSAGAKDVVRDIPVVFSIVADPVGAKLTGNLESSGRNVTGVSHVVPLPSQMKALTAIAKVSRLGVVYNPLEQNSKLAVSGLAKLAGEFGYHLEAVPVAAKNGAKPDAQALQEAMAVLLAKKPDVLYLPSDSFLIANAGIAVDAAVKAGIPVFSATEDPIRKAGALAGLVSTYYNVGRFAAYKAESILVQGRSPADIPIETLNRFTFLVNLNSVKSLGVYPPIQVMQTAEVIR